MSKHLYPEEIWLERSIENGKEQFKLLDYRVVTAERYIIDPETKEPEVLRGELEESLDELWSAMKDDIPGLQVEEGQDEDRQESELEDKLDAIWEKKVQEVFSGFPWR